MNSLQMNVNCIKKKVAVWGTGSCALNFYYSQKNKYDVVCFYDNDISKHGSYLNGIPVMGYTEKNAGGGDVLIIIASSWWKEISVQLDAKEKKALVDYVPVCLLGRLVNYSDIYALGKAVGFHKIDYTLLTDKKIVVAYGNCQMSWLERAFTLYKGFTDEYLIVKVPKVYEYELCKEMFDYLMSDAAFWTEIDLFVYQTVRCDNRFGRKVATDKILDFLTPFALKVNILNLYFTGYFPQTISGTDKILHKIHQLRIFAFVDKYIDKMLSDGVNGRFIKSAICRDDFISEQEIEKEAEASLAELVLREKNVDVKITDYIIENYREEQLFYSRNHPIEKVLLEYADRIMKFIGFHQREVSIADVYLICGILKGQDIPVYPAVIKALGLKSYEKYYYPNRYLCEDVFLNFEDFVDLYIEDYKMHLIKEDDI